MKKQTLIKRTLIIGVMGGAEAKPEDIDSAYNLGALIAKQGWILLNGGRNAGIMEASAKGAFENRGITIGILPDDNHNRVSEYIKIPILTGMGIARNCINVLSSDVVVACPGGTGTLSEIALALKIGKIIILMNFNHKNLFDDYKKQCLVYEVQTPEQVIEKIKELL